MTLIDPNGSYAAYTRPQGNGNYGAGRRARPVAGTWTAIVFLRDGTFTGPVHLRSPRSATAPSTTSPSSTLPWGPGESGSSACGVHVNLSPNPGDSTTTS